MGPVRSWGPGETMSGVGDPGQSPGGDPAHHIRERKGPATHFSVFISPPTAICPALPPRPGPRPPLVGKFRSFVVA